MIANLQRTAVLLAIGLLILCITNALQTQSAWPWAILACLLPFAHSGVLASEFLLMRYANRRDTTLPADLGQLGRAWVAETWLGYVVFAWRQPFRHTSVPDNLSCQAGGRRGVILVHGYACNRGIWNVWLRRLLHDGVPTIALTLENPGGPIESHAPQIEAAVARLERIAGRAPIIVAHSMGGLAARAWYAAQRDPGRIHRLITLGTPHQGTWLATFGLGHSARQMRIGSTFLEQLGMAETQGHRARMLCVYSHCDNIVFPAHRATLPGAENQHIEGCAHIQLIDHRLAWSTLKEVMQPGAPERAPGIPGH